MWFEICLDPPLLIPMAEKIYIILTNLHNSFRAKPGTKCVGKLDFCWDGHPPF